MIKQVFISTLVAALILFLWSGVTQMFPWGVPTAQAISAQSAKKTDSFQTPNLVELPAGSLTTDKFDQQMVGKISTLTTDKSFSWIISSPIDYYNVSNYFIREVITQLLVAFLLSLLIQRLPNVSLNNRLIFVGIMGSMAAIATYGQQLNWWGMPASYAVGAGFNMVLGWLLVAFVVSKWLIKPVN
jgi:hypothetical protein